MKKAARYTIKGTVQGVFFRQFIKEQAARLQLTGYARNKEDGSVEVHVEGEKEAVQELEQKLREGPKHSQIRNVEKEEKKWTGEYKNFDILRF